MAKKTIKPKEVKVKPKEKAPKVQLLADGEPRPEPRG